MKKDEKLALWSERIHDFQTSGQSCKAWCQENQIPVSTMGYWMRRLRNTESSRKIDLIFAKMLTEQEIAAKETVNSLSPIHIFIADSIRVVCLHSAIVDIPLLRFFNGRGPASGSL